MRQVLATLLRQVADKLDTDIDRSAWVSIGEQQRRIGRQAQAAGVAATARLAPLPADPPPEWPDAAQPLTPDQRANLEKLRDRYAPDRQPPRRGNFNVGAPNRCYRCGTGEDVKKAVGDGGYVWACPNCPHPAD